MFNVMVLEVQLQIYSIDLLPEVASSSIVSIPTELQTFRSRGFVGGDLFWIFLQVLFSGQVVNKAMQNHEAPPELKGKQDQPTSLD